MDFLSQCVPLQAQSMFVRKTSNQMPCKEEQTRWGCFHSPKPEALLKPAGPNLSPYTSDKYLNPLFNRQTLFTTYPMTMPASAKRRQRRRAAQQNAQENGPTLGLTQSTTSSARDLSSVTSASQVAFTIVRTLMRRLLIWTVYLHGLTFFLGEYTMYEFGPEVEEPNACTVLNMRQFSSLEALLALHEARSRELVGSQREYGKQISMWGLECSKAEREWDRAFIAQRKQAIAKLDEAIDELAKDFDVRLHAALDDLLLVESEEKKKKFLAVLYVRQLAFGKSVEATDREVAGVYGRPIKLV